MWAMKSRSRIFDVGKDTSFRTVGVDGFLGVVGEHLGPDMIRMVRSSPTPENLAEAFTMAREKANIPCSLVGRMFPRDSRERLVLMEYGKTHVSFDVRKWRAQVAREEVGNNGR